MNKRFLSLIITFAIFTSFPISIYLANNVWRFWSKAAGTNAKLYFAAQNLTTTPGSQISLPLYLDTDAANVAGADIFLHFDKSKLTLIDITADAIVNTGLKQFVPVVSADPTLPFDKTNVITQANQNGDIKFGALAYDLSTNTKTPVNGILKIATLKFQILANTNTQTSINFVYSGSSPTTTDIVLDVDPPVNLVTNTNQLSNIQLTIAGEEENPEISPTITTTPSPTLTQPEITSTVTRTPTPTQTAEKESCKTEGQKCALNFSTRKLGSCCQGLVCQGSGGPISGGICINPEKPKTCLSESGESVSCEETERENEEKEEGEETIKKEPTSSVENPYYPKENRGTGWFEYWRRVLSR